MDPLQKISVGVSVFRVSLVVKILIVDQECLILRTR